MAVVGGLRIVGGSRQRCPYTQATVDAKLLARRRPHLVFHSLWRPVAGRDRMRVGAGQGGAVADNVLAMVNVRSPPRRSWPHLAGRLEWDFNYSHPALSHSRVANLVMAIK